MTIEDAIAELQRVRDLLGPDTPVYFFYARYRGGRATNEKEMMKLSRWYLGVKGAEQVTTTQTFSSGAQSSGQKPRYDMVPQHALERIARRFELGATKYSEENWKQGLLDKDFIIDRLNHAVEHLLKAMEKIKGQERAAALDEDDDLAAACVSAIFAMGFQQLQDVPMQPVTLRSLRGEDVKSENPTAAPLRDPGR